MPRFPSVRALLDRHDLLPPGIRLGVGVSGGADSTALLDFLAEIMPGLGITPVVLHLDHGLRENSDEDARFVQDLARARGFDFHTARVALSPRGNVEAVARRARYEFFAEAAAQKSLARIAIAHTADDQVETFLDRLLRGSGRTGLAAMPPLRRAEGYLLVRPFLSTWRVEILADLATRGIPFRQDPMNEDERFTRVRIRRSLLPILRTYSENVDEVLLRTAEILGEEEGYLARAAEEASLGMSRPALPEKDPSRRLARAAIVALPRPLLRRVLRQAVWETAGGMVAANHEHIEAIDRLLSAGRTGDLLHLPSGLSVHLETGDLVMAIERESGPRSSPEAPVEIPGLTRVAYLGITVAASRHPSKGAVFDIPFGASAAVLDAASLRGAVILRSRRPGDRFQPLGMEGSKKLQDLLSDAKIPRRLRDRVPVLADDEGILWVAGVRQAERTRVTEATREIVRFEIRIEEEPGPEEAA